MTTAQSSQTGLCTLPEEILSDIFNYIHTKELLYISTVSHRVRACVNVLFSQRMRNASSLDDFNLVFECSTPAGKNSTPYHRCMPKGHTAPTSADSNLSEVYSRFHPLPYSGHDYSTPVHQPTSSLFPESDDSSSDSESDSPPTQRAATTIVLEDSEFFAQLCASAIFVRLGPRSGMFSGVIQVFADEFFRIRRSELKAAATSRGPKTVWVDLAHNVGLKIRVHERRGGPDDEDDTTVFVVEYEELLVRTGHILSVIEEQEKNSDERNSVVIGLV
ncbi:hypothetical protein EDC01DRAFT_631291 [Geopyxis carbonaria]|nr:hypothetical protein EDC01DRAFT_631291 [Geopyxis carbonaria]